MIVGSRFLYDRERLGKLIGTPHSLFPLVLYQLPTTEWCIFFHAGEYLEILKGGEGHNPTKITHKYRKKRAQITKCNN